MNQVNGNVPVNNPLRINNNNGLAHADFHNIPQDRLFDREFEGLEQEDSLFLPPPPPLQKSMYDLR